MSESTPQIPNLLDDDQLNEHERAFIEIFQSRHTAASDSDPDDGSLTSAETEPESGTPASTPASAAPGASTVEGPDGAPATEPSGSTTETPPPPAPDATSDAPEGGATPVEGESPDGGPAQPTPAFTFAGVDYTPEQLTQAVRVHDWFSHLNDNQVRAVDALLSGQYRLVPAHEAAPTEPSPSAPPPAPAAGSTPAASPASPAPADAGDWLDPRAQAEVNRLNQIIEQQQQQFTQLQESVKQSLTPVVQTQQSQQQQQLVTQIDAGSAVFKDKYQLDDSALDQIQQAVHASGVFPSLINRHNGNVAEAMTAALDMMFWTTPQFRDAYLQSKSAAEQAELVQQQQQDNKKKSQLTALSASGGSVPRREPVPSTREGRYDAMVAAIAADQNGQ